MRYLALPEVEHVIVVTTHVTHRRVEQLTAGRVKVVVLNGGAW
jgi:hypothetical protein